MDPIQPASPVLKTIVVGTDFSPGAGIAVQAASEIARHHRAGLQIVHATHIPDEPPMGIAGSPTLAAQWRAAIEGRNARVERNLGELRRAAVRRGADASSRVLTDYPDVALTRAATDLLVLGARGEDGQQAGLGSLAARVVRTATCPVLLVRHHHRAQRILVSTDFSPTCQRTLETALAIAGTSAVIHLVHVVNPALLALDHWPDTEGDGAASAQASNAMLASARARGHALVERFRGRSEVRFKLVEGRPARALRRILADGEFDVVAVGSHGHRGWRRFVLGTVAESIARYAPCSVLVVPTASRPGE